MMRRSLRDLLRPAVAAAVLLTLAACSPSVRRVEQSQVEIRSALEAYLPKMAQAYATGEPQLLAGLASQREVASVDKNIRDLARQGKVIHSTLKEVTLEDVSLWGENNATVKTVEVWDVRIEAAGSDRVLSEEKDQRSRVLYQLKLEDGVWRVLTRMRQETSAPAVG